MAEAARYPHEHIIRTRVIDAPADAIFAVLSDPTRHHDTEPTTGRVLIHPEPDHCHGADLLHEHAL